MTTASDDIDTAALDWAMRTTDPSFVDWAAFEAWLAADARHARRYDAVSSAIGEAAEALATLPPRPVPPVQPRATRSRRGWLAGALAAGIAGVLGWAALPSGPQPYSIEAAPGAPRRIALAGGSSIALAGGSRVTLDRSDPRTAALERGEALFTVRHDPAHPFRVTAGDHELVDLGTVFNVKHDPSLLRVAVSEGEVMLDPRGGRLRLPMGKAVALDLATNRAETSSVDPSEVGSWRDGQLSYAGARLEEVAADVARLTGRRIAVAPDLRGRLFRGTIDVGAIGNDRVALGALLGVTIREAGGAWELVA